MFPTPYKVGWHTHSAGAADARGNTTSVHTPALNVQGTPVDAIGIQPAGTAEPDAVRVEHDLELLLPARSTGKPKDVVDVFLDKSIGQFEVDGYVQDSSYGPFAPGFGGVVVKLRRLQH